jgi:excinuclease ABC subunit B
VGGKVILYADNVTGSMERAIAETNRRREEQLAYNREHGTVPQTVHKEVRETVRSYDIVAETQAAYGDTMVDPAQPVMIEDLPVLIGQLENQMKELAKNMEFERAAEVRDEIGALRKLLGVSDGRIGVEKRKLPGRPRR